MESGPHGRRTPFPSSVFTVPPLPAPYTPPMVPYRIVRWVNEVYPMTVFFLYLGLFLLTFAVCFLIPVVGVLALLFALFALIPAVALWQVLQASERWLARGLIRGRVCPACGKALANDDSATSDCLACGAAYETNGARVVV